jgi:hypothetical protein
LAIRDLIDDDNFPRIHQGDFLRYEPGRVFNEQPFRIQAGGLVTETREIQLSRRMFSAIVGNPPYISVKEMRPTDHEFYVLRANRDWPGYGWRRAADIYTYFWLHAEKFLAAEGVLALLTQAGWLDVDYGIPVQRWILDHFRIEMVLETEAEPWFTDARVATVVTVLRREEDENRRRDYGVRFVQFRARLEDITGLQATEPHRQAAFEDLRDRLLAEEHDRSTPQYRIRIVQQQDLESEGTDVNGRYVGSK